MILNLPIDTSIKHMKEHQDTTTDKDLLDHWSLLNIKIDRKVKEIVNQWEELKNHQSIYSEPCSLWHNEIKLVKSLQDTIYDIVHSTKVLT